MFKKIILALSLAAVPVLAAAGCSNNVSPGQEFTLPVGRSVTVTGENLTIKFIGVTVDSRSPKGVQTIWAGEAKIQLEITRDGVTSNVTVTEIGNTNGFTQTIYDKYVISSQLQPYPEANKQPKANEYRLLMKVGTANSTAGPPPGAGGMPIVDNGAIVKGEVKSVTSLSSRPVWALEIIVQSVQDMNNLPNMVTGKEGQVIVVLTQHDGARLKAGQNITAAVKLSGDEFGTFFSAEIIN